MRSSKPRAARLPKGFTPAIALAAALMVPGVGSAQEAVPDDEELRAFTQAYVEIEDIREEVAPEMEAASTPEEAAEVQDQANDRMMAVLDEHELEIERYAAITSLLNQDEELRSQFEVMYRQLRTS